MSILGPGSFRAMHQAQPMGGATRPFPAGPSRKSGCAPCLRPGITMPNIGYPSRPAATRHNSTRGSFRAMYQAQPTLRNAHGPSRPSARCAGRIVGPPAPQQAHGPQPAAHAAHAEAYQLPSAHTPVSARPYHGPCRPKRANPRLVPARAGQPHPRLPPGKRPASAVKPARHPPLPAVAAPCRQHMPPPLLSGPIGARGAGERRPGGHARLKVTAARRAKPQLA